MPVHIATKVEDDFRLRADQLRAAITPRTKLLILPYPNNPTGGVMDAADLKPLRRCCAVPILWCFRMRFMRS